MEILFTADLHLNIHAHNPRSGRSAMEDFADAIRCLNVGADYGQFRGVVYNTANKIIRWVGEKLPA
jgi:hypothetical protein